MIFAEKSEKADSSKQQQSLNLKTFSSKTLASIISILVTLVCALVLFVNFFVLPEYRIENLVFSILLLFILIFLLIHFVINSFILKKIKPIYRTINSLKSPEEIFFNSVEDKDLISEISSDVADWAKNKTAEIKILKDREKYTKEFVSNVAHELKTPIFNIQGYILTLLDGGLEDVTINRKYLKRAEKNINRLITTIKDVDTISQLEAGVLKLNFEEFSIVKLIDEIFEMLEMKSKKHGIELKFHHVVSDNVLVNADKKRIYDLIHNLVINSIKYGKPGGQTSVSVDAKNELVFVKVSDNGIGIEDVHLPRIFERFYRVDKSRSREQGGSGLGLAIVKHIIEAHKQQIKVESELNKGTTFTFTLQNASYKEMAMNLDMHKNTGILQ